MSKSTQTNNFHGQQNVGAMSFGERGRAYGSVTAAGTETTPDRTSERSRLLMVVVADVEYEAVMEQARAVQDLPFEPRYVAQHTVYDLGLISATEVMLAQVAPGVITPDAAGPTAGGLIDAVKPDHLILVGICYGLKDDDPRQPQRLGDVLIANQLRLIAHRKVTDNGTENRGGAPHPSPTLLDRLRSAAHVWRNDASVHFGPVLTESVLVNSRWCRQRLKDTHPDAIGGEMEGGGFYAAAVRGKVDWALVKGISDWGYDKDDSSQAVAARNAASLVLHMVRLGALDPSQHRFAGA